MKLVPKGLLRSMAVVLLLLPVTAMATNGYFLIGFGAKSRGMGGVGVAYPMGGMAAAFNPATMIDAGSTISFGIEAFAPERAVKHDSVLFPADVKSKGDLFPIPSMGGVSVMSRKMAWGFAVTGAGLGTDYDQTQPDTLFNWNGVATQRAVIQLMQMQMLPSIAYKYNDQHTFGATFVVAAQVFQAKGLQAFGSNPGLDYSSDPAHLTNMGRDYSFGYGVRLGWLGKFLEDNKLSVGFNYSSRVFMSEFKEYSGLFAEQGDFDIPENYTLGFAYKLNPKVDVAFDIQQINYSSVDSVGNAGPLASDPSTFWPLCPVGTDATPCQLGGDKGLGFGWEDQTVYKIGGEYKYSEKTTLRAGYNYGKSPIPEKEVMFNMLAPATVEHHLTFGATFSVTPGMMAGMLGATDAEVSINYMHAFINTIKGQTFSGPNGTVVVGTNAALAMEQDAIGVSYGAKF